MIVSVSYSYYFMTLCYRGKQTYLLSYTETFLQCYCQVCVCVFMYVYVHVCVCVCVSAQANIWLLRD